jgi:tetratricopeptide (TPR) repeat protein
VQRQADAHGGGLAGGLQSAVAQFVQGEFRPAAAALAEVAARARAEQRPELAAEALRWLGHAHSRLGAPARAAAAFAEGAEVATAVGFKRLQVECLCGLGTLHDSQGQSEVAVAYLRQALAVAESMDGGGGPSRADVLVHLARSLMPTDAAEATAMLEDAVRLREAKVAGRACCVRGGVPACRAVPPAPTAAAAPCASRQQAVGCLHGQCARTPQPHPSPPKPLCPQIVELHEAGERNGMASAIMEHASALATLAGARYGCQRYHEARDAYAQVLEVFGAVGDADRVAQTLVSLANLHELQVGANRGACTQVVGGAGSPCSRARAT